MRLYLLYRIIHKQIDQFQKLSNLSKNQLMCYDYLMTKSNYKEFLQDY